MTTPRFSEKLDGLPATLDLLASFDPGPMAASLARGSGRQALAIGSGGSVVAAEYFVRCRDTLGLGPTLVATPMQAVTDHNGLGATQVWLFSAGGDNPDVTAAVRAVADRDGSDINLVTRNSDGGAAALVARLGGSVHLVPVADIKDGYLATHSLVAMSTGLLLASALASREPGAGSSILAGVTACLTLSRTAEERTRRVAQWAGLRTSDTLIVASDPLLRPVASLLDTSLWEAALCPVQSTDFRNLAHGRHAWLHHRMDQSALLALTGSASRSIWSAIDAVLPARLRRIQIDCGSGGRLANLFGLIDGLAEIEAIGATLGIDPGKPGIGDFGRAIYDDRSLETLAQDLPARVRHKRAAMAKADSPPPDEPTLVSIGKDRLRVLAQADIGGAVFDYDGTVVATDKRYELPDQAIVDELVRLHRLGLKIGIATGRGGSAGNDLRKVLPADMLGSIDIGYYNGGYVRTAEVDIKREPPATDAAITATVAWLKEQEDLFLDKDFKTGPVQVCIDMHRLRHPYRFQLDMSACPQVASGAVRLSASGHSFDIIPSSSSKTLVVEAVQMAVGPTKAVLCFGDSGASCGNDHALLAHPYGISIGEVCGAPNGCWSLFGGTVIGPQALLKVLSSLVRSETGGIRLDLTALALDS